MFDPATAIFLGIPFAIYKLHRHRTKKVVRTKQQSVGASPDKIIRVGGKLIPEFYFVPKNNRVSRAVNKFQNYVDQPPCSKPVRQRNRQTAVPFHARLQIRKQKN